MHCGDTHHVLEAVGVPLSQQRRALVILKFHMLFAFLGHDHLKQPNLHSSSECTIQPVLVYTCIAGKHWSELPCALHSLGQEYLTTST